MIEIKLLHDGVHCRAALHRSQLLPLRRAQEARHFPFRLHTFSIADGGQERCRHFFLCRLLPLEFGHTGFGVDMHRSTKIILPVQHCCNAVCLPTARQRLIRTDGGEDVICRLLRLCLSGTDALVQNPHMKACLRMRRLTMRDFVLALEERRAVGVAHKRECNPIEIGLR